MGVRIIHNTSKSSYGKKGPLRRIIFCGGPLKIWNGTNYLFAANGETAFEGKLLCRFCLNAGNGAALGLSGVSS